MTMTLRNIIALIFSLLLFQGCFSPPSTTTLIEDDLDQQIASMSLEARIGQMMALAISPRLYHNDSGQFGDFLSRAEAGQLGGMMFYKGEPYAIGRTIERVQAVAAVPLLVMADLEWGITMRVTEGTTFLQNMAVGATGSAEYAYDIGRITAEEARSLGVHIGFAPVLDVNSNPDNVIINTRSYGEDPELVARLGGAFIRGMQEHGLYATAKHFPGHGDTNVDSHIGLPVIKADEAKVRSIDLAPFEAAVDAGVKCMMVAHITYSAFKQMHHRPASLDPFFIEDVLRKEMGFEGLVFTDALDMGGIRNNYWSGEAAVMAVNAGVDMLLLPPNFDSTFEFLLNAVRHGRISEARINQSVKRILQAKRHFKLTERPVWTAALPEAAIGRTAHQIKAEQISNAAVTLASDSGNIIPLAAEKLKNIMVLTITDGRDGSGYHRTFLNEISRRVPGAKSAIIDRRTTPEEVGKILSGIDSVQAVIAGIFVRWGSYKGSISLPDSTRDLMTEIFTSARPTAILSFGSPYVLRAFPDGPSVMFAYDTGSLGVKAAVRGLFGEIPLKASLPVNIPGKFSLGAGVKRSSRQMALVKRIDDAAFAEAYAVLTGAIDNGIFPGAQLAVLKNGELLASRGFGRQTYEANSPLVDTQTIYDLASVTKVAATTMVAMSLADRDQLSLDIPVSSFIPEFRGGEKDSVKLRHLITHSSGLPAWKDLWNQGASRDSALQYIYHLPLIYAPGDSMVYSDLGLLIFGEILEMSTGKSLDRLANDLLYRPLKMTSTGYKPAQELLTRIAPTEVGGDMKRGLIHGDVHDENAQFWGGVAAHAGLFSTAEDLAAMAQMLLNEGIYNHRRFLSPEIIKSWTSRQNIPPGSGRGLGWDTPSDHDSSAGDLFSPGSFGHLGFTGTSFWVDPQRGIAVILLTNRVHPTRERGGMYKLRREFHQKLMSALIGEESAGSSMAPQTGGDK